MGKKKKKEVVYSDQYFNVCLGNLSAVFLQPDASEIEFHVNRVSVSVLVNVTGQPHLALCDCPSSHPIVLLHLHL